MWWILLSFSAFAQEELDLSAIKKIEEKLPSTRYFQDEPVTKKLLRKPRHQHPFQKVRMGQIIESGTEYGHVKAGKFLVRLEDNQKIEVAEEFYGKFFRMQDEYGYKYLQSNDGKCLFKLRSEFFTSVNPELELYEPPLKYTPAPTNIIRADYDKDLTFSPEASISGGYVIGSYMKDLFNDENAGLGLTSQYSFEATTKWKHPIKPGMVFSYEKSFYNLKGNGRVIYTSPSFGPVFKSKDFYIATYAVRIHTQFRVSPYAKAFAQTVNGDVTFDFNSADLFIKAEHPMKNLFGEFLLGIYFQSQWLNIKDQPEIISVSPSNQTNKSFGFSLAQVFE